MSQETTWDYCNKCGLHTNHDVVASEHGTGHEQEADDVWFMNAYDMLKCRGCLSITMRHTYGHKSDVYPNSPPEVTYYPPRIARRAPCWIPKLASGELISGDELVPRPIGGLMLEIYTAVQSDLRRLVAMGVRAVLESVMVERVSDQRSFKANLDAFVKAGYLSVRQQGHLEAILEAGHAAMHRVWEPTADHINILLDITESIIETVYLHERGAAALDRAVPRQPPRRSAPKNTPE